MNISIGELSRRSGVKVPTIRYYEEVGLLPPPPRTEGRQRRYGAEEAKRLLFIRHARELGFELNAVRELVEMADRPEQSCAEVDAIARRHLAEVDRRLEQLTALRASLAQMIGECGHGRVGDCRIVETLAGRD